MTRVRFAGGALLEESPMHPTADGRRFGALVPGDTVNGERVVDVAFVPYTGAATWDVLPDSDSATYFAGGVLVGSTLAGAAARVTRPILLDASVAAKR
jgi:hypothetical protein